jgi:hypothetical protein
MAKPSATTEFVLQVTDQNGCSAKDTILITVNDLPNIVVPDLKILAGINTATSISGNYTFNWSNGSTSADFVASKPGLYSVTVTNVAGCSQIISFNVSLDSTSLPNIYLAQPALLGLQQITNSDTYQWYLEGNIINGATNQTIVPPSDGFYTSFVHYTNGFEAITPPFLYKKTSVTDENGMTLKYYPNPVKNVLHFEIENAVAINIKHLECKFIDLAGKIVLKVPVSKDFSVDVSNLLPGQYYFQLKNEKINFKGAIQVIK